MDRHKNKWHTQVRDIPPDVWARIKASAMARQMNIGEYITSTVVLAEQVRDIAEQANDEDEFYKQVTEALEKLNLEAVVA
jgi:hypothetical protein